MEDDADLHRELEDARATIRMLQDELAETNRGLIALTAELEERVEARTAQLQAVNRDLESFAYSVAHDLRAPLRAIAGFSQIVLEDNADRLDAQSTGHLGQVIAASREMGQLIDALLRLARLSSAELQSRRTDLGLLARAVLHTLAQREPGREVGWAVADDLEAWADEGLLRVVLENLIGNAWKFTRRTPAACIEVGGTLHQGRRAYFVRDNGAGFDMAYAHRLFGAFQRLHAAEDFEGMGIGLATVQRIIHRHGGLVWAEGRVGAGATFSFTLGEAEGGA